MAKKVENSFPKNRRWSLVVYCSPEYARKVLDEKVESGIVRNWAMAYHDKDEGKEPHTHIVIYTYNALYLTSFRNWFTDVDSKGELTNTLGEVCRDFAEMWRYLIHEGVAYKDKYQYSSDVRTCLDPIDFEDEQAQTDSLYNALDDILNGMSLREAAKMYGRDFILHYNHIRSLVNDIREQENW